VPDDLALVGYDDIELAAYTTPALSTVSQPKCEMGRMAVEMLANRIDKEEELPAKQLLQPVLVVRKSCGAKL
jgi:LacI family transcriptional regulator